MTTSMNIRPLPSDDVRGVPSVSFSARSCSRLSRLPLPGTWLDIVYDSSICVLFSSRLQEYKIIRNERQLLHLHI